MLRESRYFDNIWVSVQGNPTRRTPHSWVQYLDVKIIKPSHIQHQTQV
jgi:hypothetical protein